MVIGIIDEKKNENENQYIIIKNFEKPNESWEEIKLWIDLKWTTEKSFLIYISI